MAVLASGCVDQANLLQNPGFEDGLSPWHVFDSPHWLEPELSSDVARTGRHSLRTHVVSSDTARTAVVAGALQEISFDAGHLPESLSGYYLVGHWNSTAPKTYVNVIVMAFARDNATERICPAIRNELACQTAFVLAGVPEPPLRISNRRFVIVQPAIPVLNQWHEFNLPIAQTYASQWNATDPLIGEFRVYLEARYEVPGSGSAKVDVDVYWDDLRLAPAGRA